MWMCIEVGRLYSDSSALSEIGEVGGWGGRFFKEPQKMLLEPVTSPLTSNGLLTPSGLRRLVLHHRAPLIPSNEIREMISCIALITKHYCFKLGMNSCCFLIDW